MLLGVECFSIVFGRVSLGKQGLKNLNKIEELWSHKDFFIKRHALATRDEVFSLVFGRVSPGSI
jgi:hypothetical protein